MKDEKIKGYITAEEDEVMKDNGFNNTYDLDMPEVSKRAPFKTSDKGILRNHKDLFYTYTKDNLGKVITDSSPYVKVDGDLFDHYVSIHPGDGKGDSIAIETDYFKSVAKYVNEDGMTPNIMPRFMSDFQMVMKGIKEQDEHPAKNKRLEEDIELGKVEPVKDLDKLKKDILEYVRSLGMIGAFTFVDRRYINNGQDDRFPYDVMLVMGMEMPEDQIAEIPYPTRETGKIFDWEVYVNAGNAANKITDFIRNKGYKALSNTALGDDINFVPHAVNAGLGMYSTHGILLTKEYGTRLRLCSVTIDTSIELDGISEDMNFEEFCARCRMCYKTCPTESIPRDEHEWFGQTKRRVRRKRCGWSMGTNRFCGHCLKVCPISKFGYGKVVNQSLPEYNSYNVMSDIIDKDKIRGGK